MVRAVLFDLDDTLFDHRQCARMALAELHRAHASLQSCAFDEFERLHARFLEELHHRVLAGELPLDEARQERFRRLFQAAGVAPDDDMVATAASAYRHGYQRVRQPIAGAVPLLRVVKQHALVGIVSNNLLEEQRDKLRCCALDEHVDALVVSEDVGISKPDPGIFAVALERLGCTPQEAVMVGDSWAADVVGAIAAGIRAIWFNPLGRAAPDPDALIEELKALEPAEAVAEVILRSPAPRRAPRGLRVQEL
jgi:putative hydrolase of the HAD superfamily